MIAWETEAWLAPARCPGGSPAAGMGAPRHSPDASRAERAWQGRVWTHLSLAAAAYGAAPLLMGAGPRVHGQIAWALFGLGTLLLWRLTRMLREPTPSRNPWLTR